jgi:mannose-6-phosphate isomerase-like protein (cupin superfamily)
MKLRLLAAIGLSMLCVRTDAQAPITFKSEGELIKALTAGAATPNMQTAAVSNDDRHRINLVRRTKAAGATAHEGFAELHHIVEGSGTLVTGGTIVGSTGGGQPATIQGGASRHVTKGDVILIPPGVPHWYQALDGDAIAYLEVRWAEK